MSFLDLLNVTVDIKRPTHASVGGGRFNNDPATIATGIAARRNPASSSDRARGDQMKALVTHAFYLPAGTDVKQNDLLLLGGKSYRVLIPDLTPSAPTYLKVLCEEVQASA
jgi:hypothetical protein